MVPLACRRDGEPAHSGGSEKGTGLVMRVKGGSHRGSRGLKEVSLGPTTGTVSDEGPEPLGVFAEVKPLPSTFSELQKPRHSSAIHFHYLLLKRVCLGYLPYPPSTDPCSRLACVGTVGLATDLSRMLSFAQHRGQAHGGIRGDFRRRCFPLSVLSRDAALKAFIFSSTL